MAKIDEVKINKSQEELIGIQKKEKPVVFKALNRELKLVMDPGGTTIDVTGRKFLLPGRFIQFNNGEYVTSDINEIEFIRKDQLYKDGYIAEP